MTVIKKLSCSTILILFAFVIFFTNIAFPQRSEQEFVNDANNFCEGRIFDLDTIKKIWGKWETSKINKSTGEEYATSSNLVDWSNQQYKVVKTNSGNSISLYVAKGGGEEYVYTILKSKSDNKIYLYYPFMRVCEIIFKNNDTFVEIFPDNKSFNLIWKRKN